MGYYIDPPDMTKEQWLEEHALIVPQRDFLNWDVAREAKKIPLMWVDNGLFTALGIAYDRIEAQRFADGTDGRPARFYWADENAVLDKGGLAPFAVGWLRRRLMP